VNLKVDLTNSQPLRIVTHLTGVISNGRNETHLILTNIGLGFSLSKVYFVGLACFIASSAALAAEAFIVLALSN
jgi:hypothetical protein